MPTIFIGHCDRGCKPPDLKAYLAPYHMGGVGAFSRHVSLRDDDRNKWRRFKELNDNGTPIAEAQALLSELGFMPRPREQAIFGYVTQAATRLFQEYVRTIENEQDMVPDGFLGEKTLSHMKRWSRDNIKCDWADNNTPSNDYLKWFRLIKSVKNELLAEPPIQVQQVQDFPDTSDTLPIGQWNTESSEIHLIGIRAGEQNEGTRRVNDDLFVLLLNGQVFKFWGSTDPNTRMASRSDEAFLVEGQHKYRFAWHKISNDNKIYRALRPYSNGVLVYRDRDNDNRLTEVDTAMGLDSEPNPTINIHWSGIGRSNWSAGCQVIAGKSYINHNNDVIDCSSFAASSYSQLNTEHKKTKGAYNMLADLILVYAKPDVDYLYYTLGRDETILRTDDFPQDYAKATFARMIK